MANAEKEESVAHDLAAGKQVQAKTPPNAFLHSEAFCGIQHCERRSAYFIRKIPLKLFILQRLVDGTAAFFDDAATFIEAAKKQRLPKPKKAAKKRK